MHWLDCDVIRDASRLPRDASKACSRPAFCLQYRRGDIAAMNFYFDNTILQATVQYRVAARLHMPVVSGEWQQATLTAAELVEQTAGAAAPLTLFAVQLDPDQLRGQLQTVLGQRSGAPVEVDKMAVKVMCTSTLDRPRTSYPEWVPVPDGADRPPEAPFKLRSD